MIVWGYGDMHRYACTAPTHMQDDKWSKKCQKIVANVSSTAITKIQEVQSIVSKPRLKRRHRLKNAYMKYFSRFSTKIRVNGPPPPRNKKHGLGD